MDKTNTKDLATLVHLINLGVLIKQKTSEQIMPSTSYSNYFPKRASIDNEDFTLPATLRRQTTPGWPPSYSRCLGYLHRLDF